MTAIQARGDFFHTRGERSRVVCMTRDVYRARARSVGQECKETTTRFLLSKDIARGPLPPRYVRDDKSSRIAK